MSKEEFSALAEKYMDTIYRTAYSWTGSRHDANDVTQDVLLKLYQTDKAFSSDDHLRNWLVRVTVNQCKMLFRSPWRRMEDIGAYAETLGFEDESHLALFTAVMKLDRKYRVPLLLFYYEGYSTAEISALLDLSEGTVSTRLFRARAQLKTHLKEA